MRKYGVSSVQISTMKGSHEIPHVEEEVAKRLRDDIAKLARLKELLPVKILPVKIFMPMSSLTLMCAF